MRLAVQLAISFGLCAITVGCSSWRMAMPKYQTVVADPHRDGETAKLRNDQANKALQKRNLPKAEQLLQEALAADVEYGPAHNNLGLLYHQTGRYYLAAWEFEYAIQTMSDRPEPHNNLGNVLEAVDRLDDAIQNYATAHTLDPANPVYLGNLVRAMIKQDEHDAAIKALLSELLLCETRPDWNDWARERLATGKFNEPTRAEQVTEGETVKLPPPINSPSPSFAPILPAPANLRPPSPDLVLPPRTGDELPEP